MHALVKMCRNWLVHGAVVVGLTRWTKPYKLLTQSSKLSGSLPVSLSLSLSSICGSHCESLSGPCCLPGMCWSSKWKVSIEMIQWLMLADGAVSGLLSIPLMYRVLTSMIKLQTLTMNIL
jgi:hypothetical protein